MALRRMMRINEATGVMLEYTDKTKEIDDRSLRETSFVWLSPVEDPLVKGMARSEEAKPTRVPGYVWPQGTNLSESHGYVAYWASCLRLLYLGIWQTDELTDPWRCI